MIEGPSRDPLHLGSAKIDNRLNVTPRKSGAHLLYQSRVVPLVQKYLPKNYMRSGVSMLQLAKGIQCEFQVLAGVLGRRAES